MEPGWYAEEIDIAPKIVVAQSEDGDLLLVDPGRNFSVSIFRHDDPVIDHQNQNIVQWLEDAAAITADVPDLEADCAAAPPKLLGRWRPCRSATETEETISASPDIEFQSDGAMIWYWTWPTDDIETGTFAVGASSPDRLIIVDEDGASGYRFHFDGAGSLILTGPDSDDDMIYRPVTPGAG